MFSAAPMPLTMPAGRGFPRCAAHKPQSLKIGVILQISHLRRLELRCQAPKANGAKAKSAPAARRSAEERQQIAASDGKLAGVLTTLAVTGASTGTFLDGIHSRVSLLRYDVAPLTLGGLHTSAFVPPLLAGFYLTLGGLVLFLDYRMAAGGDPTTHHVLAHTSLARMALSVG
jgi:heat shock protein 5